MRGLTELWLCKFLFIFIYISFGVLADLGDPYKILGVDKKATQDEIKRAYKHLAKSWHPDKAGDQMTEKFVEIKQAYELLSDTERRKRYDLKGITEENYDGSNEYNYQEFKFDPFDDIPHMYSQFSFQENDITFFHKLSITSRQYHKHVISKSDDFPYLIFFYSDWCFPCLQTAPHLRKLIDNLEPLGVNFATVHSGKEPNLVRRLSINSVPSIVLIIEGNSYVFKETITSLTRLIEFIRQKMPYELISEVYENNVEDFLNGWTDNRVRALLFLQNNHIRLRYLILAYRFRKRISFGIVMSSELYSRYQISKNMETLLLFNENVSGPTKNITIQDMPINNLHNIVASNQYLALPRLSSQDIFESLCPVEWHGPHKKLCVILVTENSNKHDRHREAFRIFAQNSPYSADKVRFVYVYHDKQIEFVNSLIPGKENIEPVLRVVIIWRRDSSHVKYEWLKDKWENNNSFNDTIQNLEKKISQLMKTKEALMYSTTLVNVLLDEHTKGIYEKIIVRFLMFWDSFFSNLSKEQILPVVSIVGTVVFILLVGYLMSYLVRLEEENIKKEKAKCGDNNNETSSYQPELKLHELRAEKYNGLVRLLKPGCRTILLILDMESRHHLIPPFHRAVWPYRRNKTLMFAYMYVERGLSWYKQLLELALPGVDDLKINPRNCVGTVLSLNGHRKYFCIFHAKHTEKQKQNQKQQKLSSPDDCETGHFVGFDSSSESDEDSDVILEENLLVGLPNWLDRLFEGSTKRYYFNYWPDFPNK